MLLRRLDAQNFDMQFGHGYEDFISGSSAIEQKLITSLQLIRGEWFLNERKGFPWTEFLKKNVDMTLLESLLKADILSVPGVSGIRDFSMMLNRTTRILSIRVSIQHVSMESAASNNSSFAAEDSLFSFSYHI